MRKFVLPISFLAAAFLSISFPRIVSAQSASLDSITVIKTAMLADNSDVQTATVTLNAEDPALIDRVSLLINYRDDSGNPDRGYVSWYRATGFKKESGYGSQYIDLKVSDCAVETQTGKLVLTFKWTALASYGEMANNDLAYYVTQNGGVLFGGWQNYDTNFNVHSMAATLSSIIVAKPSVLANNADVQTASVTLNAEDPASLERVSLLINYMDDSGNPNRGYVSWYKAAGFKKESGYGSEYIDLKVSDCAVETQAGKLIITFKWTSLASYGEITNNDLAYYVAQYGSALFGGWQNYDANFNVHSMAAALGSITVAKPIVLANNADAQTATVIFNAEDPASLERVSLLINYRDDSGNPDRGYISWYKATGFKKESGYGSEYIDLKIADCAAETQSGKLVLTFKWTALATYGEIANNDLAYYVTQYGQALFGGWQNHDTNFSVHSMAATLGSITVAKPTILANNADIQTATVTLNAEDPASVERVSLLINYRDDSGNPDRGYISWYKATGFKKESGYGSQYIDLKAPNCAIETQTGKLILTFKWTTFAAYGEMANNDLAYYVTQYGGPLFGGWQEHNTNFNVILNDITPPAAPAGLVAVAGDSSVELSWSVNTESDLAGYNVYRSQTPAGPYTKINAELIIAPSYSDTGLTNRVNYYYVCTAQDTTGNNSGYSNEINASPVPADAVPPQILDFKINNGELYALSSQVTLTINAQDAGSGMGAGAQASFSLDNSSWTVPEDYGAAKIIELPAGEGTKTVYAKFKDAAGNWSGVVSDTIILDTTPPQLIITSPLDEAVIRAQ